MPDNSRVFSTRGGWEVVVDEPPVEDGPILHDLLLGVLERDFSGTEGAMRLVLRLVLLVGAFLLASHVQKPRFWPQVLHVVGTAQLPRNQMVYFVQGVLCRRDAVGREDLHLHRIGNMTRILPPFGLADGRFRERTCHTGVNAKFGVA